MRRQNSEPQRRSGSDASEESASGRPAAVIAIALGVPAAVLGAAAGVMQRMMSGAPLRWSG